ncbi:MAG: hypothetical protein JWM56_1015 [Candidatus Peribacteria bacterium]|nr:hypothetical protein [Candidatus Peribacteria bacterium]
MYAEIYGAHTYQVEHEFMSVFWKMMPLVTIAGGLLVVAYILGFSVFQNIWIIGAVSMTSILIVEPFIAYSIFRQLPTKGALVGMIMGTIGLIITLYE